MLSSHRQDHRMQLRQVGAGEGWGAALQQCRCAAPRPGQDRAHMLWVLLVSWGSSPTSLDLRCSL